MTVLDWGSRVAVIGEVGQAHDGSLGTAHAFIDAIADAGAGAVKFQTHIAAAESRTDEPWRVKFSGAMTCSYTTTHGEQAAWQVVGERSGWWGVGVDGAASGDLLSDLQGPG